MRHYRRLLAALAVSTVVAAACGQSAAPAASPSTAATATAAARGAGGDLKILYWQAPTILNPHQATGTKDNDASRLVIEPLAAFANDGSAVAVLAAEIPTVANGGVSSDFKTVTWKLKQGVKWSDGTPFTADDAAFTYTYVCDPKTAASTGDRCEGMDSVTAKDANTLVVKYTDTNPFYFQWGVGTSGGTLQKAQYKDCVGDKAKNCPADLKPIGTGPYVVKDFKPGDTVLYEMNPNYRDAKKPFFKTVTFKGGGDAAASARAVCQTGDVDYGWNLQVEAAVLKPMAGAADSKCQLLTNYGSSVERILINFSDPNAAGDARGEPTTKHPFLTDIHVRRALAMATDRSSVATQLYGDGLAGKATCNILTAPEAMNSKNTASLDVCKFDLAAANKELDDAGYAKGADGFRSKGGVKLEVGYRTTVNAVRQKTQDIMKKNWESIGVKVNLTSVPASTFFTNTSPDGANHFWTDIEMYTNSGDPDPTSYFKSGWTCSQIAQKSNNWNLGNYSRYCNKAFDDIVSQLQKETDQSKRTQLAIQANDLLIKDVVIIPLITRVAPTASGVSKSLKGISVSVWDSEMWNIADWTK